MKSELFMFLIILIVILNMFIAVVGVKLYFQDHEIIEQDPAVYDIRRTVLEPEFERYDINDQQGKVIAVLNLYLEDFQHDCQ